MAEAVRVHGLRELTRTFRLLPKEFDRKLVDELKEAAEPVKQEAESLALSKIRNMTEHWSGMRIGVSKAQGLVYMVPAARGRKRTRRPNLANLLQERAMDPAVEQHEDDVIERIDGLIGRLADGHGF